MDRVWRGASRWHGAHAYRGGSPSAQPDAPTNTRHCQSSARKREVISSGTSTRPTGSGGEQSTCAVGVSERPLMSQPRSRRAHVKKKGEWGPLRHRNVRPIQADSRQQACDVAKAKSGLAQAKSDLKRFQERGQGGGPAPSRKGPGTRPGGAIRC